MIDLHIRIGDKITCSDTVGYADWWVVIDKLPIILFLISLGRQSNASSSALNFIVFMLSLLFIV
jgi:hypothetical protein